MTRGISFKDLANRLSNEGVAQLLLLQGAYRDAEQRGHTIEAKKIKELYNKITPPKIAEIISEKEEKYRSYSGILEELSRYVIKLGENLGLRKKSLEKKTQTP